MVFLSDACCAGKRETTLVDTRWGVTAIATVFTLAVFVATTVATFAVVTAVAVVFMAGNLAIAALEVALLSVPALLATLLELALTATLLLTDATAKLGSVTNSPVTKILNIGSGLTEVLRLITVIAVSQLKI